MNTPEIVKNNEEILAIIIPSDFEKDGIEFFTPDDYAQQLAYMKRAPGYKIMPHIHKIAERTITKTQEVLFIKKGKLKINFFDSNKVFLKSHIVKTGDIILLASGGHGFEMIEETEMYEVKQGPYLGEDDKIRFEY